MNNGTSLAQYNNEVRMAICNNDHTVKIYSVPTMERIAVLNFTSPINHGKTNVILIQLSMGTHHPMGGVGGFDTVASTSPDGRKMVCVSDTGNVYLYDIRASDYQLMATMKASEEAAQCCGWNQSSEIFAVTSQDGYVNVWDIRHTQKLCQLGSAETRNTRKAARSIQFSKGPLDLLAYTEHVSHVNIVDTRTFESRQVVRLSPAEMDYHIAGFSFSPDNRSLFVGLEHSMVELAVDVNSRRQFAGGRLSYL
ncbi:hypothetical protein EC973_007478 [Apophysomyces ossiformis]|uniref:DUF2415 domain-containing protein n=1 Tax=Apophysomyces ossiformis TaxID=679940 RepID=A0A8H7ERN1_9FUNG|nr:hypothetical protein EC973_007478 [Apophysomyces ossiformis]